MKTLALVFLTLPFSVQANGAEIPKAKFVAEFLAKAPASFCDSKSYFGQCFSVPEKDCQAEAAKDVASCVSKEDANLPAVFHQPADGSHWGEILGSCAGEMMENAFAKDKHDSAECKDASKWEVSKAEPEKSSH